jgi:hypothetical protein
MYLGQTAFRRGLLALTTDEQRWYWREAADWLEAAAEDIEFVRGQYAEAQIVDEQTARLGLVANKEKVYVFAIQLHKYYLRDASGAFNWLERLKSRAFLDALALTPLDPPDIADNTLLDREREVFSALRHAITQNEVVALNDCLHAVWDAMSTDPAAGEYVALRRGEPIRGEEILTNVARDAAGTPNRSILNGNLVVWQILSLLFIQKRELDKAIDCLEHSGRLRKQLMLSREGFGKIRGAVNLLRSVRGFGKMLSLLRAMIREFSERRDLTETVNFLQYCMLLESEFRQGPCNRRDGGTSGS